MLALNAGSRKSSKSQTRLDKPVKFTRLRYLMKASPTVLDILFPRVRAEILRLLFSDPARQRMSAS